MLRINDVKAVTPATTAEADIIADAARAAGPSTPPAMACPPTQGATFGEKPQIVDEALIEEVSIDGMCGVY